MRKRGKQGPSSRPKSFGSPQARVGHRPQAIGEESPNPRGPISVRAASKSPTGKPRPGCMMDRPSQAVLAEEAHGVKTMLDRRRPMKQAAPPRERGPRSRLARAGRAARVLSRFALGLAAALLVPWAPSAQGSVVQILPASGGPGDFFGIVAFSDAGDTALVGAYRDDTAAGLNSGSAYVYTRDGAGNWNFQQQLLAPDAAANDYFGAAVALSASGDIALVGAPGDDLPQPLGFDLTDAGSAHLFFRVGNVWSHAEQLTTNSGSSLEAAFGQSVALSDSGLIALVGAPNQPIGILILENTGAAYVFQNSIVGCPFPVTYCFDGELLAPAGADGDSFGSSVALSASGGAALVGAPGDDTGFMAGEVDAGSAHLFSRTGVWNYDLTLEGPADPLFGVAGDGFGRSVALSALGDKALVGADRDDNLFGIASGAAHVFALGLGGSSHEEELLGGPDFIGGSDNRFGTSVAFSDSGERALVGAYNDDTAGGASAGSAWIFAEVAPGSWVGGAVLAPGGAASDIFGFSVALTGPGDRAIVGALSDDNAFGTNAGAAYAFEVDPDGDGILVPLDNCPELANPDQLDFDADSQGDACDIDDDNDGVLDAADAFPLDETESVDTDGDGIGNNADPDDDNDGLLDGVETNTEVYVSPSDTGTDPLDPDSDGDGLLDGLDLAPNDGNDCRSLNPQLKIVWGHDMPFAAVRQNAPGIGDHYELVHNEPGLAWASLAETDPSVPASLPDTLASGVQALFASAQPGEFPPSKLNQLEVTTLDSLDPLPGLGSPGSPFLIYLASRPAIEALDPGFGDFDGFVWTGLNRFNSRCDGGMAAVVVDNISAESIFDPEYFTFVDDLVELVAHEAGHLFGLRHVLRGGLAACVAETHTGDAAVMDYYVDGSNTILAQCGGSGDPGCLITEPPDCSGQETGDYHNPLYYYLHYVLGDAEADLLFFGDITPGSWDEEGEPLVEWRVEFNFACAPCNLLPLYNITIVEVLPGGGEVVRQTYEVLTIEELNALTIQLPESSGLKLYASTTDPATLLPGETPPVNVVLETPLYPPPDPAAPVTIVSTLLEVEETSPGVYTTATLAIDSNVAVTPIYEIHPTGTYDVSDPNIPGGTLVSTSTYVPPLTVVAAPVSVPEPGFGAGIASGLVGLVAASRIRRRDKGV